jgi:hypothetical protein
LLDHTPHLRDLARDSKKQSAKVSRILSRLHAHKFIAKIPHIENGESRIAESKLWRHLYAFGILLLLSYFARILLLAPKFRQRFYTLFTCPVFGEHYITGALF